MELYLTYLKLDIYQTEDKPVKLVVLIAKRNFTEQTNKIYYLKID